MTVAAGPVPGGTAWTKRRSDDLAAAMADLPNVTGVIQADATIRGFRGTHVSFVVATTGTA